MTQPASPIRPHPVIAQPNPQQNVRRLKKGELLFVEGENSRAMYFIKTGMIRLFKKKGDSNIELDIVRSGQILGELAFLDGNPRSASGEALTDCELMEISGPAFQEILQRMPDWLKILLKTVVGRLRTASTRIRQLESASTSLDYSEKGGSRGYVYLSPIDVLKAYSSVLLVAAKNGIQVSNGLSIEMGLVHRYGYHVMGVPAAKIATVLDVLSQCGILTIDQKGEAPTASVKDINFLEQLITYLNEENMATPNKRHDISHRGFLIMSLIVKHLNRFNKDPTTGVVTVSLAEIQKLETTNGKEPFRMDEFPELVRLGYCTGANFKGPIEAFTTVKADEFVKNYRFQRVVISIHAVNEQKRTPGGNK